MPDNKSSDENYEDEFLDDTAELEIAHPSPNAEIYARTSSFSFPPLPFLFAGLLVLAIGFVAVFFYGYQIGLEQGHRNLPPLILADPSPIKKPPAQVLGGVPAKPENLNIYDVAHGTGNSGDTAETSPTPEKTANTPNISTADKSDGKNADGSVESLLAPPQTDLLQKNAIAVSPPRPDLNREPTASPSVKVPPPKAPIIIANTTPYMVQLSAARSRALARGSYSRLQSKHSALLARRDPLILRVDLGNKGIFYRVNVPGFANKSAAAQFCAALKKREQDCFVRQQP
ncbi:MAG: SPOR domain-containing protein [Parvibaculales bacterium]